ncbi:hypothetical protein [Clostridium felsineum]|uniref:Uncharacterized protein n=1 Tax=Clostridium felsineum TaxID=36839 RepID=A0A1S8LMK8_9CLOT|nr:hypothetical protein [Clostridium felsineum]URZ08615.1 hypothetical protein CLROS_039970 [Clostridium felsineum]URZ13646.1 hypothetical protein CROST_044120 [Clostridium felsineum]
MKEIISLDCDLCPSIVKDRDIESKYRCFQQYGFYYDILNNLNVLLKNVDNREEKQILAVVRKPKYDCSNVLLDKRFKFYGYDLIEDSTRISALTNCGRFDKAFSSNDISEFGLIKEYKKAKEIQSLLLENYPDEEHVDCVLWVIWRMEDNSRR